VELNDFRGSLLFPPDSNPEDALRPLAGETVRDLGLTELSIRLSRNGVQPARVLEILSSPAIDSDVIRYRQDIFSDFYRSQTMFDAFASVIPKIEEISLFAETRKDSRSPLQETIWRLGELELYVDCIETLAAGFSRATEEIRSVGLTLFRSYIEATTSSPKFSNMRDELPKLRAGLRKKQSVTIGVNLDERLRPVEATLLSINEFTFREQAMLPRIFGVGRDDEFVTSAPMHSSPVPESYAREPHRKFPLSPLFQDLEQLLGATVRPMVHVLNKYLMVNTSILRRLQADVAFFLGAASLFKELASAGLPLCKPGILSPGDRELRAVNFYNLLLATRLLEKTGKTIPADVGRDETNRNVKNHIVLNDAELDSEARLQILTGPNQGGKTTYTQGIGILQVLAQCGLYVPAESTTLSPADEIVTHFPAEEKGQLATGRLGEEAQRFAAIFETITERSMVLLNESLASTSPGEGEYLAEDIVRALSVLGARGIFATHLHGLADRVAELNDSTDGRSRLGSLVAGVEERLDSAAAIRTFHIRKGAPAGKSFASDIASQYGISFEQLTDRLRRRKLL